MKGPLKEDGRVLKQGRRACSTDWVVTGGRAARCWVRGRDYGQCCLCLVQVVCYCLLERCPGPRWHPVVHYWELTELDLQCEEQAEKGPEKKGGCCSHGGGGWGVGF